MHVVFVMANNSSVPYFNWFAEEASKQTEFKFSFVCLFPQKPKMIDDVGAFGCDCYWIPFNAEKRKVSFLKSISPLYRLFRKLKPDVVHTHLFDDSLPSLFAARLARVKIRAITKGDAGYHYYYAPKWTVFDKFNNWNATDIVAISSENQKFILEKEKAKSQKISLIHHGIPISTYTRQIEEDKCMLRKKYSLEGRFVVGTVSRLIEWKGYRYIVDAAEKVISEIPNITFLFVGVGPQEEELKELIQAKGLDKHIHLTGWVDRKLIPSLYGIMDIYVHAAAKEPFGFVIAEAMMNGLAIISTPTGAALDIIEHKKNGILVREKDGGAIYQAILALHKEDSNALKKNAREKARELYDFKVMWRKHLDLYHNKRKHDN